MHRKTLTILSVAVVGIMSLGASCQKVTDSMGSGGFSLDRVSTGNSETDRTIRLGAKSASAGLEYAGSFDEGQQELLGETIAVKLASSPGLYEEEALNAYVTKVGLAIASVSGRSDIIFTFGILNGNEVNAISAPRGYVFVSRQALLRMQDESELAAVLAHEIGHVIEDHGVEFVRNSKALSGLSDIFAEAANDALVSRLGNVANEYVSGTLYSQAQENEADALAVKLLGKAGYDATALARFVGRVGTGSGGSFKSHPAVNNRVANLNAAARAYPGGQKLADRFAANVKK